jgi:hypothetical protein
VEHETTKSEGGAASHSSSAPATEKPVPSEPVQATSEYVVTVNNTTAMIVKIEKVSSNGERKELTADEYSAAAAYATNVVGQYYMAAAASPQVDVSALQAYYQGIADYLKALYGMT